MIIDSRTAEQQAVLNAAYAACAALRTAPKTRGQDFIRTAVVTGEDKDALAAEMRRMGEEMNAPFLIRDAANVEKSVCVVLAGVEEVRRGLGKLCGMCGFEDCAKCSETGGECVFGPVDLGIALGSAVSLLADYRVDSRIMFSVGKAAAALKLLGDIRLAMGIPLAVLGKSPFFDRA